MNQFIKKMAIVLMTSIAVVASMATSHCLWIYAKQNYAEPRFLLKEGQLEKTFHVDILLDTDPPETQDLFKGVVELTGTALWTPDPQYPHDALIELKITVENSPDEAVVYEKSIALSPNEMGGYWYGSGWEIPFCESFPCWHSFTIQFFRSDPEPSKSVALDWQLGVSLGEPSGCSEDSAIEIEVTE